MRSTTRTIVFASVIPALDADIHAATTPIIWQPRVRAAPWMPGARLDMTKKALAV